MKKEPLISCLCVTRNKPDFLKRAIACFQNQTYTNKELIIVFESDDLRTKSFLNEIDDDAIKIFEVSATPKLTLGALRNYSIEVASGDYFCQWDDDDWFNQTRLEKQMHAIQVNHKAGSILIFWLMFDFVNGDAYLSSPRAWEGSILCSKSIYPAIKYSDLPMGEDVGLVRQLVAKNFLHPIIDAPLYIYNYHGGNTWGASHFHGLFAGSIRLPKDIASVIKKIVNHDLNQEAASHYLSQKDFLVELNYIQHINNALELIESIMALEQAKGNA